MEFYRILTTQMKFVNTERKNIMSKRISASVPDELYSLMEKIAKQKGLSMSAFIKHCLTVYVTAYGKKMR